MTLRAGSRLASARINVQCTTALWPPGYPWSALVQSSCTSILMCTRMRMHARNSIHAHAHAHTRNVCSYLSSPLPRLVPFTLVLPKHSLAVLRTTFGAS
jgi:hypothetical protein